MTLGPLSGRGIVITRPRAHALPFAELIRSAGGDPVLFPTIEILPVENREALSNLVAGLDGFHLAIFVSPTAVMQGLELVNARRAWPGSLRVAAVGAGTAKALEGGGFGAVITPAVQADSEGLAALPELQDLRGRSVVIFRGKGGREWLRTVLEARGARVAYAECYRRARPAQDPGPLLALWQRGAIDAVSITSGEGLQNLFAMLGPAGKGYLLATPVFVPHPRIAQAAQELGVKRVIVTGRGDDRAVEEMAAFFARV
jgi:uroporphyrinogen-III synthase